MPELILEKTWIHSWESNKSNVTRLGWPESSVGTRIISIILLETEKSGVVRLGMPELILGKAWIHYWETNKSNVTQLGWPEPSVGTRIISILETEKSGVVRLGMPELILVKNVDPFLGKY